MSLRFGISSATSIAPRPSCDGEVWPGDERDAALFYLPHHKVLPALLPFCGDKLLGCLSESDAPPVIMLASIARIVDTWQVVGEIAFALAAGCTLAITADSPSSLTIQYGPGKCKNTSSGIADSHRR